MNKELIEKCNALAQRVETPSSNWSADGKPDPHGKTYECERAGLHMGNMTDDELANGAFLNYDQPLNVAGILAGTCHSPIAWMTAVKDRIRWLSRSLEKAVAERANLEAYLRTIGEPENTFPLNPNGASKWAHLQKHDGAQAIGVVFRTGTGSVGSLVDGRVVWADWLAHPNGSKPESVNAELLEALKDARHCIGIDRDTLVDCHTNPCTGYLDPDGALAKAEYDDVIDAADAAIARAERRMKSPAERLVAAANKKRREGN